MKRKTIKPNGRKASLEKGRHLVWQVILVIMQPIESKPSLFARLGQNYMVKLSSKTQADNSFPRNINRKIHFRYIGVYILDSTRCLQKLFSKYLAYIYILIYIYMYSSIKIVMV